MHYVEAMRERGLRPASIARHVRGLRACFSFLVHEEVVGTDPFAGLRLSVPETIRDTPSAAQVDAVLAAAKGDRRAHAILAVLVATGCRRGELAALTPADLDLRSGVIRLRVSKSRARVVPLDDRAVAALAVA